MVNWTGVSAVFFVVSGTIFIFYLLVGFVLVTPPQLSPDLMVWEAARKKEEATIMFAVISILFLGGVLSFFGGLQQERKTTKKASQ